MTKPVGIILAGGLSSRMQGHDKTLLDLNGQPLINHCVEKLQKQTSQLVINANGDTSRFDYLGLPIIQDTIEGFAGPLAGVLAGLQWAKENHQSEWIITAAADTPFFPDDYTKQMMKLAPNNKIILASSDSRRHPVFGLWHVSLADALEAFLIKGDRKVMLFVQDHPNDVVDFEAKKYDPFFNINTPDDLATAKAMLKENIHND
jgi:molybdopterin-guanine dinucleotide biosynthesis protein A